MKAIGIILAGGNNDGRLGVLTDHRAAAALPIGSCYRAIDFTLSNMSNSGIGKVAVLTQYNSRSLRERKIPQRTLKFLQMVGLRQKAGRLVRIHAVYQQCRLYMVPRHGGFHLSEYDLPQAQQ